MNDKRLYFCSRICRDSSVCNAYNTVPGNLCPEAASCYVCHLFDIRIEDLRHGSGGVVTMDVVNGKADTECDRGYCAIKKNALTLSFELNFWR